jgi:hypothetical protein
MVILDQLDNICSGHVLSPRVSVAHPITISATFETTAVAAGNLTPDAASSFGLRLKRGALVHLE